MGEKDAVKVNGKDSHRIPIVWGYNTAPLILNASGRESQLSSTLEESPLGWVCIGRTWVVRAQTPTARNGQGERKACKKELPGSGKPFLVLLQGLLMGRDFLGQTHLCGLFSQLETGMSSV